MLAACRDVKIAIANGEYDDGHDVRIESPDFIAEHGWRIEQLASLYWFIDYKCESFAFATTVGCVHDRRSSEFTPRATVVTVEDRGRRWIAAAAIVSAHE